MDVFGPLLSAVGSVANSVLNFLGVRETNRSNQAINERSLEQQAALQYQSQGWLHDENELSRQWNSPVNQMNLYREAGINPFLSESSQVGYASSAPGAAPSVAAPNQIPMQSPHFDFDSAIRNVISTKAVDASSAANRAEAFSRFVGAIPTISRYLDNDAVKSLLDEYLPQFVGSDYIGSQEYQLTELAIQQNSFKRDIASIEAQVAQKYGDDKAQQELWNLQQESAKVATQMGLWNSLAKLNDTNRSLNEAKIKECAASIYHYVEDANYKHQLGLTAHDMRVFTVGSMALQFLDDYMNYETHAADFEEESGVREYKQTGAARSSAVYDYGLNNNPASSTLDFVVGKASKAVGLGRNQLPSFGAPWRDRGYHYQETRPNQFGGKTTKRWTFYPDE